MELESKVWNYYLKGINTEEELLRCAKLSGQVIISKFKNTGPFPRDENYTGLWKRVNRQVCEAIARGNNKVELSKKWVEIEEGLMEEWVKDFKEAHQNNSKGPGFPR